MADEDIYICPFCVRGEHDWCTSERCDCVSGPHRESMRRPAIPLISPPTPEMSLWMERSRQRQSIRDVEAKIFNGRMRGSIRALVPIETLESLVRAANR